MSKDTVKLLEQLLSEHYIHDRKLRKTNVQQIDKYIHKATGKSLAVIRSKNNNDEVYRRLLTVKNLHLPEIYEVISSPEQLVVLEEFIEGEQLSKKLNGQPLDYKIALDYMNQLCDAVLILHEKGIIHRDIKPENIMIQNGQVVLMDFSISRILRDGLDRDTMALGSVGYAAPEQFGFMQTGTISDIYSLGVLFNELLTGCHPTEKIADGAAGRIIRKCLQIETSKRYKSISLLKSSIRRL